MRVTLHDARVLVGRFMAFDKHMNIVLGDCEEFRVFKPKGSKEEKEEKRTLGLTLVRGECVVSLSVEGPPPKDDSRIKAVEKATTGPGTSAAAGRGELPRARAGCAGMRVWVEAGCVCMRVRTRVGWARGRAPPQAMTRNLPLIARGLSVDEQPHANPEPRKAASEPARGRRQHTQAGSDTRARAPKRRMRARGCEERRAREKERAGGHRRARCVGGR
jgi:small nuclear ribonucleoprotein (snRNP)-like protein